MHIRIRTVLQILQVQVQVRQLDALHGTAQNEPGKRNISKHSILLNIERSRESEHITG